MGECKSSDCLSEINELAQELSEVKFQSGEIWLPTWYNPKSYFGAPELKSHLTGLIPVKEEFVLPEYYDKNAIVLSDFQFSVVDEIQEKSKDSIQFTLIPISVQRVNNVRVNNIRLNMSSNSDINKRELVIELSNHGKGEVNGLLVRLNGGGQQIGSAAISLNANETGALEFEIEDSEIKEFKIEVEDYETSFDNDYFFVLPEVSPISVCIVSLGSTKNFEAVFGNKKLFDVKVYNEKSLNFEELFSADLLILDSFSRLPDWLDSERIVGDLIIIPTIEIDEANYSRILKMNVRKSSDSSSFSIASSSIEHPLFNGIFNDINSKVDLPYARSVYSISGGEPLLAGRSNFLTYFENRKIYWFASPLNEPFTNLKNHSMFLPLMYRIAESTRDFNEPLSFELNTSPIEVNVEANSESVPVLINENGQYIPELNYVGAKLIFTLPPDLNEPGIYHLVSGKDTLKTMALNIPIEESKMDFMGYEELTKHFQNHRNVTVLDATSLDRLEASLEEMESGKPLWKYGLILALMFLLAETAIHRWMK